MSKKRDEKKSLRHRNGSEERQEQVREQGY
jgi:hypothetical protein